jgi:hypothetical protein
MNVPTPTYLSQFFSDYPADCLCGDGLDFAVQRKGHGIPHGLTQKATRTEFLGECVSLSAKQAIG